MPKKTNNKVIVIVGTTASGKTGLAVALAHKYHGEIVSADSRQVYKYMDIGTGKDLKDFRLPIEENENRSNTISSYKHNSSKYGI